MLDRTVVEGFLNGEFEEGDWEIPGDISKDDLVEAFCQYTEDDYYEWLKDNLKSFFNHGNPDWDWIRKRIKANEE
ncbi:unnamed protein product [marine sediment metagenome]|uniref:Uncharacterized protein n=1 Tax=marine sediment metagenome TaxID=412755 RepID=X1VDX4_9ZZZZ